MRLFHILAVVVVLAVFATSSFAQSPNQASYGAPSSESFTSAGLWGRQGGPATYRILPRTDGTGRVVPGSPVPTLSVRPTQPYSYGWFGTQPSPAWSRSFGSRRNYTQWSLK